MSLFQQFTQSLLNRLPEDLREMLEKHEREGTTDDPEYQKGMEIFNGKFVCTLDPWPRQLLDSFAAMEEEPTVYRTMIGVSEFHVTGTLSHWTVVDDIPKITYPTLLTNGADDEVQDSAVTPFFKGIKNVKWAQFGKSSHMAMFEEKERYFEIVAEFLTAEE